jgi:hypothetical protein
MSHPEQVKSPNYPKDESQIRLDLTDCGMMNEAFRSSIESHGNGQQLTWESYATNDYEVFTVRRYGDSAIPAEQSDRYQMSKWILDFGARKKTLLLDLGANEVMRYEGEFTVPASNLDISDLVAAYFNLHHYENERRDQGWDPYLDLMLHQKGLM